MVSFIKRIRWKAFFFERRCQDNNEVTANFGFKSFKTSPKNDNLNQFESDLYDMVQNIEFKKVKSLIPADKTNNLYKLTTEEYNKLLLENISKSYKKTNASAINAINTDAKAIAKDLRLNERIEQDNQNQSFITLKYNKENFQKNPKCRLINPAKSEIGIVSKHYINHINKSFREKLNVNQWRKRQAEITWFKDIKSNNISSFIKFDTGDIYLSISKDLLLKAINFS